MPAGGTSADWPSRLIIKRKTPDLSTGGKIFRYREVLRAADQNQLLACGKHSICGTFQPFDYKSLSCAIVCRHCRPCEIILCFFLIEKEGAAPDDTAWSVCALHLDLCRSSLQALLSAGIARGQPRMTQLGACVRSGRGLHRSRSQAKLLFGPFLLRKDRALPTSGGGRRTGTSPAPAADPG